jgi:RimJ/RimL family protein N-acetyltransferase
VIAGGEVTLRPWDRADTVFVYDCCQDIDIQRWTKVPRPYSALDAASFIDRHARAQPEDDAAFFAITRTDTGELLGSISYNRIDWAFRWAEVGYWIAPDARRQGVAAAAVEAIVAWGSRDLGLVEVRLLAARGNAASQGVALKAGFAFTQVLAAACQDGDQPDDGFLFVRPLAS